MTRVLVVEDSATQAEELRLVLEAEQFDVSTAHSAEQALERLAGARFDAVISDIVMPGRSGYELCRQIKADPAWKELPVILLTTLSNPMDIVEGLEAGADNFLTKPYEPKALVRRVSTIVENKRMRVEGKLKVGIEFLFMGRKFVVGSEKEQILDLLISTFEDTVTTNRALQKSQSELAAAQGQLQAYARQMEQRARASEEHLRTVIEAIDDIVFTLDREQRFTSIVGRSASRDGRRPEDYLGKTARELFGAELAAPAEAASARALAGERALYDSTAGSGEGARHYQTVLSPLRDEAGQVTGVAGVSRDVTEQKKLQTQLMVSDRMASIGTLAAGVAHEINNPLSCIIANLEMIAHDVNTAATHGGAFPNVADLLSDAREAADRVRLIVRDLKIFSRSHEERRGPTDVHRVLESTLRMAWNELRHRARLVKQFGDIPPVDANDSRLGQVFLNLVMNAAQAMVEGRADKNVLQVTTRMDEGLGRVIVEVSDTGAGMPPEVLERLFTPFFTTKPVGFGTGLGLSICQRIVTGFGGQISVRSAVGAGTTFTVALCPAPQDVQPPAPTSRPAAQASRRGRVLVIDDDVMVGTAVRRTLAAEHDVQTHVNAREALEAIKRGPSFDVILCDLMMPDVTGMDLHAELARVAPEEARKIIFLTGGAFTPRARTFLDEVENQRVEKPFDGLHLRALISDRIK